MLNIQRDYSLLRHNTFGMDVRAAAFVEYSSEAELREAAAMLRSGELPSPWLHIGGGSNLLFTGDWPGTVLHSSIVCCKELSRDADTVTVRVGSGMVWDDFVALCVERGWYGPENLSAVPGETGAAAVQNIGAYGVEVKDMIAEVETLDMQSGEKRVFAARECGYGYRSSVFKCQENKRYIVLSVVMRLGLVPKLNLSYKALAEALKGQDTISAADVRRAVCEVRASKLPDPAVTGSAGSFFTNPVVSREKLEELQSEWPAIPYHEVQTAPDREMQSVQESDKEPSMSGSDEGRTVRDAEVRTVQKGASVRCGSSDRSGGNQVKLSAGWLIEQCGWKGRSLGRAGVYPKQALVLVNLGGASGAEVVALADAVRNSVRERFGVELYPEVNIL